MIRKIALVIGLAAAVLLIYNLFLPNHNDTTEYKDRIQKSEKIKDTKDYVTTDIPNITTGEKVIVENNRKENKEESKEEWRQRQNEKAKKRRADYIAKLRQMSLEELINERFGILGGHSGDLERYDAQMQVLKENKEKALPLLIDMLKDKTKISYHRFYKLAGKEEHSVDSKEFEGEVAGVRAGIIGFLAEIGELNNKEVYPLLIEWLRNKDEYEWLRGTVVKESPLIANDEVITLQLKLLSNPQENNVTDDMKEDIVYALGEIGDARALDIMKKIAYEEDMYDAERARRQIEMMNSSYKETELLAVIYNTSEGDTTLKDWAIRKYIEIPTIPNEVKISHLKDALKIYKDAVETYKDLKWESFSIKVAITDIEEALQKLSANSTSSNR